MENQKNSKVVISLLIIIIGILTVFCILFATGTISFNNNTTNNNQKNINDNNIVNGNNIIQTKLVDNLNCSNSETTFNEITVKVEQKNNDGICSVNSVKVNDKDIKNDVSMWIDSYEIYDNNVIIFSGSTSGKLLTIYSLSSNSVVMKLEPNNLSGYWVASYTTNNNIIIINGKECGEQCGNKSTGYSRATFEIEYSNNTFSSPKLVDKLSS